MKKKGQTSEERSADGTPSAQKTPFFQHKATEKAIATTNRFAELANEQLDESITTPPQASLQIAVQQHMESEQGILEIEEGEIQNSDQQECVKETLEEEEVVVVEDEDNEEVNGEQVSSELVEKFIKEKDSFTMLVELECKGLQDTDDDLLRPSEIPDDNGDDILPLAIKSPGGTSIKNTAAASDKMEGKKGKKKPKGNGKVKILFYDN
ncbi:hypothetical protein FRX31_008800 [Thalictrum thalictroides]|uniref:Uncharacterized protein n=1 Tax=Thalictrum thalictroides TaxID=46969 RepID=A0A7J6WX42_THATH|nr:hypothetical protein FRX31_008800 [Thalictrum thalictroides]